MNRKYNDSQFINAVHQSTSIRQVLSILNLQPTGGNYKTFHSNVKKLNLDISHFSGQAWNKDKKLVFKPRRSLQDILIKNSTYSNSYKLKLRLIKEGLFQEKCYTCNLTIWNSSKIPLELEHINGVNNDNRIENLTLLCPNCHALTSTYRGKNKNKVNQAGLVE